MQSVEQIKKPSWVAKDGLASDLSKTPQKGEFDQQVGFREKRV
jgi:hypothetical protein